MNNKWYIPITQPVEFDSTEVSVDPYALGLLLGDGCFYDAYQVSFTKPDNELHEYLGWTRRDDTSFAPIEVREKLYSYGLIGTRANSKFIPEDYKFNSVENRWALLAGLMDTDGSVWDNGVVEYTTVSPHLRDGVIFLVQSLGGTCRLTGKEEPKYTYKGETFIGQMAYRIVVNIPKNPFRLRRKAELWNKLAEKKKYHPTRAIIGYDYIGKEECQCISVASPDHSYLLEDFIVTHNTIDAGGVAFFHPEWNPVLWIVKSALKYQTASFIMNWMGDAHVPQIINTSKDWLIPNLKHYIVGYDMLVPKTRTMKSGKIVNSGFDITQFDRVEIKLVILDECQQIKNVDSTRTQMVRRVVKNRKVIPLSGTPWNNRGSELFPVLNMMDPMKFNSEERFKMNWVDYYWQGSFRKEGGIRKIQQFKEFTKDLLIRRERNEVMRELPEVNRTKLNVIMDAQQEQTYDDAVEEFVTWFQEQSSDISGMHLLAAMAKMRHLVALAKIPTTLEYVDEFVEDTDRKIVIFAHHQDVQSLLYEELRSKYSSEMPVLRFVAGMKSEEVDKVQTTFNNSPRTILVASQLAAGEGLNLQTCCDCVMHERQFNASKEEQCEGRFVRIGSTATSVNSVYAHMQGLTAIDATLDAIVERKRIQFHALMNKGEAPKWNEEAIVKELAVTIVNAHHAKKSRRKVS